MWRGFRVAVRNAHTIVVQDVHASEPVCSVEVVDWMGSDLTVVNAARVSFDRRSSWDDASERLLSERDRKLIKYLAEHKHESPFTHPQITFCIEAPIFVARQLLRHRVGLTVNEVSRRYVDAPPRVYMPPLRKRAEKVKQGSMRDLVDTHVRAVYGVTSYSPNDVVAIALRMYDKMIEEGVAPEVARAYLPQGMFTSWWWTGSLLAFSRVVRMRTDLHAQRESMAVAYGIHFWLRDLFPCSWEALVGSLEDTGDEQAS